MARPEAPFESKYIPEPMSGCWLWLNALTPNGYGHDGNHGGAHRRSYELHVGPIPAGMQIDHLCRNRACVNPDHLEVVTMRENIRRSSLPVVNRWGASHCRKGHEYDESNTTVLATGYRACRACSREYTRQYRNRRKAA